MRTASWIAVLATGLACASGNPAPEERFTPHGANAVRDTRTGLVWLSQDSGRGLSWTQAAEHCHGLASSSGTARWRLPSIEELGQLYDTTLRQPCGERFSCRIDPAVDLSTPYQWSDTAPKPDRRVYFDFSLGSQLSPLIRPTLTRGTLCTHDG
jgi:hypothetical protein